MLSIILYAWALVFATVAVHVVGLATLLRRLMKSRDKLPASFWPITRLLTGVTCWLMVTHMAEIAVWGMFYYWQQCLPDAESAFYFAGVTYTTTGYGDLVLAKPWRMLAPVESLTGIIMCGLSASVFFAVVTRIFLTGREDNPT